ncbi:MAG: PQQ-dependent sugar dehydrogenase [Gemmatimonadaceae bacterium]
MILRLMTLAILLACSDSQARTAQNTASTRTVTANPIQAGTISLESVAGKFDKPVFLTAPAGDARLFVVEQAGRIRVVKNGATLPTPFLDIVGRVQSGGERGLLSVAFHPDYKRNGWFFVNFTDRDGNTRIERFSASSNADVADPASSQLVLGADQPYGNHNGGLVMFGPDGMLYIGTGDGGSGGDPRRNGQNSNVLLAKMLRINVNGSPPYTIPAGNPYARSGGRREIWAIGLRNPWRFSFDRTTGMLYIADVGQNEYEEIDVEPASAAGLNYGWNTMEADHCYGKDSCDRSGLTLPKLTYNHSGGACSVTGGYVYRGKRIPSIAGHYFYSDYCTGWLRSFRMEKGEATDRREWTMEKIGHVVSFGEDASGELYIIAEDGKIFRFREAR